MSGLGLSSYFFKDLDKEAQFILAPIIGIATIVFIISLLLLVGLTGKQASLIVAFCLLTIDIIRTKYIFELIKSIRLRLVFFCFVLLIFLYYILIPLYKLGYATTTTYYIGDSVAYISATDILKSNSIYSFNKSAGDPFNESRSNTLDQYNAWGFFHGGARWGTPIILVFFSVLSGFNNVQIFTILSYIFFIISGLLIFQIIDGYIKKTNMFISFLLSLFYLFNYSLFWIVANGQISQTITVIFFLSIIYLVEERKIFSQKILIELWLGFALISDAVLLIYAEFSPFVFIPFLGYCIYEFIGKRNIKNCIYFILLVLFINPISVFLSLKSIFLFSKNITAYGIPMPNPNLFEIIGFSNVIIKNGMTYSLKKIAFQSLIYINFAGILLYLFTKKKYFFTFSIIYSIFFLIIKLKFQSPYTNYKYLVYILPFILICQLYFLKYIYITFKKTRVLTLIFITFSLFLLFRQLDMFIFQLNNLKYVVSKKYQSLESIIDNNKVKKIIYLNHLDSWSAHWIKYYLKNNEFYSMYEKVIEIQPYILVDNFENYTTDFIISGNNLLSNQYYKLFKPEYLVLFDKFTWYSTENNQQKASWRWMNQDGLIYIC